MICSGRSRRIEFSLVEEAAATVDGDHIALVQLVGSHAKLPTVGVER